MFENAKDISDVVEVFRNFHKKKTELLNFLRPIAAALGYPYTDTTVFINLNDDFVVFTGLRFEGSPDYKRFEIPLALLMSGQENVIAYLKDIEAVKKTKAALENRLHEKIREREEAFMSDRLKKKLEGV